MKRAKNLLDYIITEEDIVLIYHIISMALAAYNNTDSDNIQCVRSQVGGKCFLSDNKDIPTPN